MKVRYTGGEKKIIKGLTFHLIFISSPLEVVFGEKKNARLAREFQFFSTVFINPDIFIK